jgi:cyclopropane fatty-acyl-phospholipid synthase-like methyltransferase
MTMHCRFVAVALIAAALLTTLPPQLHAQLRRPDVRYVPTPQPVVEAMLAFARVTQTDTVYDLGSGDGRIPITAAKKFGARGVGIEIDPFHILQAQGNLARAGVANRVTFLNQDLFEADISGATVVALFLFPTMFDRLIPKLKRDLKPGTRIVAYHFSLGDQWPADSSQEVDGGTIYLWTIGVDSSQSTVDRR